ncbi:MAG: DNA-directed RNA polymerase subunit alpha [Rickettsiales bacterium]
MLAENWKDFLKPSKISYDAKSDNKSAKIVVEPLERGFGTTIGNSLRRILLSSIFGTAFTAVKIEGVIHEQDSVEGLSEDIIDVIFNLKKVVLLSETATKKKATIEVQGPCQVTAADLKLPEGVSVLNADQVICHIDDKAKFKAELIIESGKGYRDSSKLANDNNEIGLINIDTVFSPIRRVTFSVESSRVGQVIDYDKLTLDVETNGAIEPDLAVGIAAKIMKEQMNLFINFDDNIVIHDEQVEEEKYSFDPVLLKKVDELELSVRSQNCLKNENIAYLGDLVKRSENDMLKTPNFGRKSLNEIRAILQSLSLNFGMDIPEWPPENLDDLCKKSEDNS